MNKDTKRCTDIESMLKDKDCIFYNINTTPERKLYIRAEKKAEKETRLKINKPFVP
jgi:hypothetical protein